MDLTDAPTLRRFLSKYELAAKKGLGQHFLCSRPVVSKIVDALQGYPGILEIGPGPGVLTSPLSERAEKYTAIELDSRMIEALAESAPQAEVRQEDALKTDLNVLLRNLPEPKAVVSNLPYYITGPLLTRIAEARHCFQKAVLMMQKEVAQRVLARAKESARGSLSVYLQLQFEIRKIVDAPAGAFLPPPKVDSTVLEFMSKPDEYEDSLFKLIRFGFAQPRKTMVNNLLAGYHVPRDEAMEWLTRAGLDEKSRPQELSNEQWLTLHASH